MHPVRSEPYRLFFPLGAVLGGIGVSQWLLIALGIQTAYSGRVHALIQIQSFLMAFACGFLMTMVPRRTQSAPATPAELVLVSIGLIAATVGSLGGWWLLAEGGFLLTLCTLAQFAIRRFRSSAGGRTPPDAFVLIPLGLLQGVLGAVLVAGSGRLVGDAWTAVGLGFIQEGMFLCLALGIGHLVVPLLSGYEVPADGNAASGGLRRLYAVSGLVILGSFPLQVVLTRQYDALVAFRVGYGLRAAVALYHLLFGFRAYRLPRTPGLHRWMVWSSFWMLPLSLGLVVLMPAYKVGLLHVLFVGGFSLMTFGVGCHVILSHGDFTDLVSGRPWQVAAIGLLSLLAMLTRVSAEFLATYELHRTIAAATWLIALGVWIGFLVPKVVRPPPNGR